MEKKLMTDERFKNLYARLFYDDRVSFDLDVQKLSIINQLNMATFRNIHIIKDVNEKILDVEVKVYDIGDAYEINFSVDCNNIHDNFNFITGYTLFKYEIDRIKLFEKYITQELIVENKTINVSHTIPKKILDALFDLYFEDK